ncbi:hypothetical protein [Nocardia sp. NPDC057455]|uniref:hypothetical protein n=1 Tax=Nocardia sp. NPDC057455 TaxID=3346138 RepID=UPI00367256DD
MGGEQGSEHQMPLFAVKLVRVETLGVRAERWDGEADVPSWVLERDHDGLSVSVRSMSDSQVGVTLSILAREDGSCAVETQLAAIYYVALLAEGEEPPEQGNIEDTAEFLKNLGKSVLFIANQGIEDLVPFVRELVHSTSGRMRPGKPIVVSHIPPLTEDAEMVEHTNIYSVEP